MSWEVSGAVTLGRAVVGAAGDGFVTWEAPVRATYDPVNALMPAWTIHDVFREKIA